MSALQAEMESECTKPRLGDNLRGRGAEDPPPTATAQQRAIRLIIDKTTRVMRERVHNLLRVPPEQWVGDSFRAVAIDEVLEDVGDVVCETF